MNNEPVCALVDSGSAISAISYQWFIQNQTICKWRNMRNDSVNYVSADSGDIDIKGIVPVKVSVGQFSWKVEMRVVQHLITNCIIGADFLNKSGLVLDWAGAQFYFRFRPQVLFNFCQHDQMERVSAMVDKDSHEKVSSTTEGLIDKQLEHVESFMKQGIKDLCEKFPDVLTEELGLTGLLEYRIELTDNNPVKKAPFRLSPPRMKELRSHIDKMMEQGVIRRSKSPYAAPIFLVPKANGEFRPVVDYRELNKKVVLRSIPLPDLHSCFGWFRGAKFFTTLDLNQAYNQIPLTEDSKPITAFVTDWNLFEFNRVPFGLATGAAVLSQLMDSVFSDIKFKFVYHYLDDLVIYSKSAQEHLEHIREVLVRLRQAGLTVNPGKVVFACSAIKFLGHVVSGEGVSINPERVEVITQFPTPRNVKQVARFIGMANFFRKFIDGFAEKAAPLNELRRKGATFVWGPTQESAFEALKEALRSAPVLTLPNFNEEFILQTDASASGLGAVLLQGQNGRKVIAYASRSLSELEKKYSVYELEAMAVLFGMESFRYYLEHREFILETDNKALSWVLARPRKTGRIARWATRILAFKFSVNSIRGSDNVIADCLSRMWNESGDDDAGEDGNHKTELPIVAPILTQIPQLFRNIKEFQESDPHLGQVKKDLREGRQVKPYVLKDDVLCCRIRKGQELKIAVPTELVPLIFKYFHESPVGGHLGVYKTREKIRQSFIWKGMDKEIRKRIQGCETCAISKPPQNSQVGFLASHVVQKPFQRMYIDFVGPLPRSKAGNKFVLVCVDAFTRFVWLVPSGGATTQIVINKLQNIFGTFGPPETLVTDNATAFTSNQFKEFCLGLGIKHITTTPYYPNPSYAERLNRNLRSALIAYHHNDQSGWDRSLHWLMIAFNTARHESHKSTPSQLLLGYGVRTPLSNLWSIDDLLPERLEPQGLIAQWRRARNNIRKAHRREAKRYNAGRQRGNYRVGDVVFLRNFQAVSNAGEHKAKKLLPRFRGPFRIMEFLTPVTLRIRDMKTGKENRAHLSQVKPGPPSELYNSGRVPK